MCISVWFTQYLLFLQHQTCLTNTCFTKIVLLIPVLPTLFLTNLFYQFVLPNLFYWTCFPNLFYHTSFTTLVLPWLRSLLVVKWWPGSGTAFRHCLCPDPAWATRYLRPEKFRAEFRTFETFESTCRKRQQSIRRLTKKPEEVVPNDLKSMKGNN